MYSALAEQYHTQEAYIILSFSNCHMVICSPDEQPTSELLAESEGSQYQVKENGCHY